MTDEEFESIGADIAHGYTLLERLGKSAHAPREDSIEQIDAFETALARIRRGDVWSNKDVSDDDLTTLREIREMVAIWNASTARPDGLLERVEKLRARERARVPFSSTTPGKT